MTIRYLLFWLAAIAIISIAFDFEAIGMGAISAAQKGAVLVIVMLNGFRWRGVSVLANFSNALILCAVALAMAFGSGLISIDSILTTFRALILLLIVSAVLRGALSVDDISNRRLLSLIQWLPLICVAFSIPLVLLGFSPGRVEGGVYRVAGASSPAHLGMLCCAAISASSLLILTNERSARPFLAVLTFAILILTGSRTALIVSLITGLPLLTVFARIRTPARFIGATVVAFAAPVVTYFGVERMLTRSLDSSGDIVTSGRDVAWSFFYERYLESPWFGHGLGSVLDMRLLSTDYRVQFFHVPHNEYLRFLVDLGSVGLAIVIASQIMLFYWAGRRIIQKGWFCAAAIGHAGYAYFDNLYGTLQYLPFLMTIGLAISASTHRETQTSEHPQGVSESSDDDVGEQGTTYA